MYKILTIKDKVRVPPVKFGMELKQSVKESLEETIEGKIEPEIGVFLAITDVLDVGEGSIYPEDGAIFYPVEFRSLIFVPELNEVVLGEIVDITEFGAFTRIGPLDALIHVSQIMDDKIVYDSKNALFTGKKSGLKLKEGDIVRARIVGVSLGKGRSKISLTMRQPCLGSLDWLEKDKKKRTEKPKKSEK
jgi:DNA-directed RNA polymerase subunit E'